MATLGEYIPNANTKLLLHLNGSSADSSGLGNNGTDTAITYSQANGKFGQGAGFNGASSYITIPYSSSLDLGTGGFTIGHWFKTTQTSAGELIHRQSPTGGNREILITSIGESSSGKLYFAVRGGENVYYDLTSNTSYNDGNWHHYVAVSTGSSGNMNIYVDGKLDATRSIGATTINFGTSTVLTIGSVYQSWLSKRVYYFNGSIDEVIVENRAWTASEVKKYYTMTKGFYATL